MAKAKSRPYLVTQLSPIYYGGKVAEMGDTVDDLPGQDIAWLLEMGAIVPVDNAVSDHTPTPEVVVEEAPEASEGVVEDGKVTEDGE